MDVGRAGEAGTVDFQRKSFQNVKQFSTLYFHSLDKIFQSERLKHCQSLFKINKNVQSIKVKTKKIGKKSQTLQDLAGSCGDEDDDEVQIGMEIQFEDEN